MAKTTLDHVYNEVAGLRAALAGHTARDSANFEELKRILLGDGDRMVGITGRVDRIEQRESMRNKQVWAAWGALLALFSGVGLTWFK